MPQLNRDQETLYSTPRLHVVFFAASALLVAAIVWMLAGDYVRDWKDVQRGFYRHRAPHVARPRSGGQERDLRVAAFQCSTRVG